MKRLQQRQLALAVDVVVLGFENMRGSLEKDVFKADVSSILPSALLQCRLLHGAYKLEYTRLRLLSAAVTILRRQALRITSCAPLKKKKHP